MADSSTSGTRRQVRDLIQAFETLLAARLCIIDYVGRLARFIPARSSFHSGRHCICVKEQCRESRQCGTFDNQVVPQRLRRQRCAFWKFCHGRILELSTPIMDADVVIGSVALGQYRWPDGEDLPSDFLTTGHRIRVPESDQHMWDDLPALTEEERRQREQVMRAFTDRLEHLIASSSSTPKEDLSRREQVELFLNKYFPRNIQLCDLARSLCLSESRTGELVRELFGQGYSSLLQEVRINHAKDLLANTDFIVSEVAEHCGYRDVSYFHRSFKRFVGSTPLAYRRECQRELQV